MSKVGSGGERLEPETAGAPERFAFFHVRVDGPRNA